MKMSDWIEHTSEFKEDEHPRDEKGRWMEKRKLEHDKDHNPKWEITRNPKSLEPIAYSEGGEPAYRLVDAHDIGHNVIRCWNCGEPMDVYAEDEYNTCPECGYRMSFHQSDSLLSSLIRGEDWHDKKSPKKKKKKEGRQVESAFDPGRYLKNNGFEFDRSTNHGDHYQWTDSNGIQHKIMHSRNNPAVEQYVKEDLLRCQNGRCRHITVPQPQAEPVNVSQPIRSNDQVVWQQRPDETWTVGQIAGDLVELYSPTGEQELAPLRELQPIMAHQPVTAMAERSGDPELDALIEEFLDSEYYDETKPHDQPVRGLADFDTAYGICSVVEEEFARFLVDQGITTIRSIEFDSTDERQYWGYEEAGDWEGYHCVTAVEHNGQIYLIDWTAAQFGYDEFPMVQRLDEQGVWQNKWAAKLAMAERSGDPELDALIDQFMEEEWKYLCGGETDFENHMDYRNPYDAWGQCHDVSEYLTSWLNERGMKAHLPEDEPVMQDMPWMQQRRDPHPDDFGYADRPGVEEKPTTGPNAGNEYPSLIQHHVVIVDRPTGRYMIDFTASQYGYQEFPMIQRLDPNAQWEREWTSKWASMVKLGASVEELAKETIEEILGYQGKAEEGHRAPRADIQKLKDVANLFEKANGDYDDGDQGYGRSKAQQAWDAKFYLDSKEIDLIEDFLNLTSTKSMGKDEAFDQLAYAMSKGANDFKGSENDAKKALGTALKKWEGQNSPRLYKTIVKTLEDLYRRNNESYKLWPWVVKQLKDNYQTWLFTPQAPSFMGWGAPQQFNPTNSQKHFDTAHLQDIVTEAGPLLAELKRENRTPQGLDVNQMGLRDLDEWLMEWKRENRESENQGEVAYEYKNGWTMQRLTTPEQLQYEGDEMHHCVGGYASEVEDGTSLIYSLRDNKNTPYVTIEVEGNFPWKSMFDKPINQLDENEARELGKEMDAGRVNAFPHLETPEDYAHYQKLQNERRQDLIDQFYPSFAHTVAPYTPHDSSDDGLYESNGLKHDKVFGVVQVQGQGNRDPKPEYKKMIREFFESLKDSSGASFVRSEDWHSPHDIDIEDEYDLSYSYNINDAEYLKRWLDETYYENWERYHGESVDEYGLGSSQVELYDTDPESMMISSAQALVDHADRGSYKTMDWKGLAEATYRAAVLSGYEQFIMEQHRERAERRHQNIIDDYVEQLFNDYYYVDEVGKKFIEMAEQEGIDVSAVQERGDFDYQVAQEEFEDLWWEARSEISTELGEGYAGDANKYFQYLYQLINNVPWPNARNLPRPSEFPTFEDTAFNANQGEQMNIPGTFSHTSGWEEETNVPAPGTAWHVRSDEKGDLVYLVTRSEDVGKYVDDVAVWVRAYLNGLDVSDGWFTLADWKLLLNDGMVPWGENLQQQLHLGAWVKKTSGWEEEDVELPQPGQRLRYLTRPHGDVVNKDTGTVLVSPSIEVFTVIDVTDESVFVIAEGSKTEGFFDLGPFLEAVKRGFIVPEEDQLKLAGWDFNRGDRVQQVNTLWTGTILKEVDDLTPYQKSLGDPHYYIIWDKEPGTIGTETVTELSQLRPTDIPAEQMRLGGWEEELPLEAGGQFALAPDVCEYDADEYYISYPAELLDWHMDYGENLDLFIKYLQQGQESWHTYHQTIEKHVIPPGYLQVDWDVLLDRAIEEATGWEYNSWRNSWDTTDFAYAFRDLMKVTTALGKVTPTEQQIEQKLREGAMQKWDKIVEQNWEYLENSVYDRWKQDILPGTITQMGEEQDIEDEDVEYDEYELFVQWQESEDDLYYKWYADAEKWLWSETMGDLNNLLSAFGVNFFQPTAKVAGWEEELQPTPRDRQLEMNMTGLKPRDRVRIQPGHHFDKGDQGTILYTLNDGNAFVKWPSTRTPEIVPLELLVKDDKIDWGKEQSIDPDDAWRVGA